MIKNKHTSLSARLKNRHRSLVVDCNNNLSFEGCNWMG